MSKKLCLFAHYDREDRVASYVIRYVRSIAANGFDVVFISASKPNEAELSPLREVCVDIVLRENCGHDFGSWADGFRRHKQHLEGELLLANDSVYGPIGDLGLALDRLRTLKADMAGFVESAAHARHLQSWFLLLQSNAYNSAAFQDVLLQDFSGRPKSDIVKFGEVGLSVAVRKSGLRVAGLFSDVNSVFADHPFNPTMLLWRELVEQAGCPFIKITLLRDNPCRIPGLAEWRKVVSKQAPDLTRMIETHLAQMKGRPEVSIAEGGLLPPSLFHYWGWYRRAYYLRNSALPLQALNMTLFEFLWNRRRIWPGRRIGIGRGVAPTLEHLATRIKHKLIQIAFPIKDAIIAAIPRPVRPVRRVIRFADFT
jgi:hypothetical protein